MQLNIFDTYCNPIVLPDYPLMPVLNGKNYVGTGEWGRGDKKFVRDADLILETEGPDALPRLPFGGGPTPFHRDAENDVRATADPSCLYYEGRWYLYCTGGMVYDSADFVHWTPHPDATWLPIS